MAMGGGLQRGAGDTGSVAVQANLGLGGSVQVIFRGDCRTCGQASELARRGGRKLSWENWFLGSNKDFSPFNHN